MSPGTPGVSWRLLAEILKKKRRHPNLTRPRDPQPSLRFLVARALALQSSDRLREVTLPRISGVFQRQDTDATYAAPAYLKRISKARYWRGRVYRTIGAATPSATRASFFLACLRAAAETEANAEILGAGDSAPKTKGTLNPKRV